MLVLYNLVHHMLPMLDVEFSPRATGDKTWPDHGDVQGLKWLQI